MSSIHSQHNNNNNELLVDKLTGALAAFRKERDGLHRQKTLAEERLRLLKEEKEELATNASSLQTKLNKLQESKSETAMKELQDKEQAVLRLQNEVNFQHAELVAKRNKVDGMKKQLEEECQKRRDTLTSLQQQDAHRRGQLVGATTVKSTPKSTETLQQALEHERMGNGDIVTRMPRWMQLTAQRVSTEADGIHAENERLARVLIGYKERLEVGGGAVVETMKQ